MSLKSHLPLGLAIKWDDPENARVASLGADLVVKAAAEANIAEVRRSFMVRRRSVTVRGSTTGVPPSDLGLKRATSPESKRF